MCPLTTTTIQWLTSRPLYSLLCPPFRFCLQHTDFTADIASSEDGSMVKAAVVAPAADLKDVEAGGEGGKAATKHYVPVLELFRGHWQGIIVQSCYEACEFPGSWWQFHGLSCNQGRTLQQQQI